MKSSGTIIGLVLVILITVLGCNNDRNNWKNHGDMMRMGQNFRRHPMPGMRGKMGREMRFGMSRQMYPGRGFETMRGMGGKDSTGLMPMGPGRRMLESIPNVTDNQKKQIEDLVRKQHQEMIKLREDMKLKMQSVLDSNRKEMINILTDEQKKFVESYGSKMFPSRENAKWKYIHNSQ
jgi:hypothetical protein